MCYYKRVSCNVLLAFACLFMVIDLFAQNECIIEGRIGKDSLRFTPRRMQQVYLSKLDEFDRLMVVDSVDLKKGAFVFKRVMKEKEPVLLYFITGFDNGNVPVFVEPGKIRISISNAAFPGNVIVEGTKTNDLYNEYKDIANQCVNAQKDSINSLFMIHGKDWMDTSEAMEERLRIGAAEQVLCNAQRIRFLLDHNDSPLAPLMMEREIYYMLDKVYAEKLLSTLSPVLMNHPYYRSFSNVVKALNLKVGGELPDITIPLLDGGVARLSDFRGKYVLLDFWASWCGPCLREMPYMKQLYAETRDKKDKFVIVSFSIDNKDKAWRDAVKSQDINREGWVNGSDLLAWNSPAARFMGVDAVPKTILVDPDGRAISFSLRGEEMVKRIKQILGGDLYYENVEKDSKD